MKRFTPLIISFLLISGFALAGDDRDKFQRLLDDYNQYGTPMTDDEDDDSNSVIHWGNHFINFKNGERIFARDIREKGDVIFFVCEGELWMTMKNRIQSME